MEHRDLLEDLKQMVNCSVISDLPYIEAKQMLEALQQMQIDAYTLSQWEEAIYYLLRLQRHFQNSIEAKQCLCHAYKEKADQDIISKKQ